MARKLSPYNKFVKANARRFRTKSGRVDMKALGRAWRNHQGGHAGKSSSDSRAKFKTRLTGMRGLLSSIASTRKKKGGSHRHHAARKLSDGQKLRMAEAELKRLSQAYDKAKRRAATKAEKTKLNKAAASAKRAAVKAKIAAAKAAKPSKASSAKSDAAKAAKAAAEAKRAVAAHYAAHQKLGDRSNPMAGLSGLNFMGGHDDGDRHRGGLGNDRPSRRRKGKKSKKRSASKRRPTHKKGKKRSSSKKRSGSKKRSSSKKRSTHKKRPASKKRSSSKARKSKGRKSAKSKLAKMKAGRKRYTAFLKKAIRAGATRKQATNAWHAYRRKTGRDAGF